jgi:zinc protease
MFRGSPGLSAAQLSIIAAAMGGDFDADTQETVTQYFFTVPSEDLDIALRVESTRMRDALDDQALWEQERGAIDQEAAQDLSNPECLFYTRLLAQLRIASGIPGAPMACTQRGVNKMDRHLRKRRPVSGSRFGEALLDAHLLEKIARPVHL